MTTDVPCLWAGVESQLPLTRGEVYPARCRHVECLILAVIAELRALREELGRR